MNRTIASALLGAFAVAGLSVSQASADDFAISKVVYENRGAYEASAEIRVKMLNVEGTDTAKGCFLVFMSGDKSDNIKEDQKWSVNLANSEHVDKGAKFRMRPEDCQAKQKRIWSDREEAGETAYVVAPGTEIWPVVVVNDGSEAGNRRSCRKDGNKFYFHPDGGTLRVKSGGTTENKNRCKLVSKGGIRWNAAAGQDDPEQYIAHVNE